MSDDPFRDREIAYAEPGIGHTTPPVPLPVKDTGYAPTRWQFDSEVTRVFDDMLERSIPDYQTMRELVFTLGQQFVRPGSTILDLGTSRGEALAPFVERFGAANTYVGVEVSEPMRAAAAERFAARRDGVPVVLMGSDLAHDRFPDVRACLILSVLTAMFIPIEHRARVIADAYESLVPGGALIFVEKILGDDPAIDAALVMRYHAFKAANGYTQEDITRKRLALEGVLVPLTAVANDRMLRSVGFDRVDCFWRWCNFAGWLAVKPRRI